jgi:hypothetical protein
MRPLIAFALASTLAACASLDPPAQADNACSIFAQKKPWWRAAKDAEDRWGLDPALALAIIHQESAFNHDARPPRKDGFLFIPGERPSSAFGYAQALEPTWAEYRKAAGRPGADRDSFEDSVDFIGWYTTVSSKRLGLKPTDARNHYLAYHEGHGGFERGTWRDKRWLIQVAAKVEANHRRYAAQIKQCEAKLNGGFWIF